MATFPCPKKMQSVAHQTTGQTAKLDPDGYRGGGEICRHRRSHRSVELGSVAELFGIDDNQIIAREVTQ